MLRSHRTTCAGPLRNWPTKVGRRWNRSSFRWATNQSSQPKRTLERVRICHKHHATSLGLMFEAATKLPSQESHSKMWGPSDAYKLRDFFGSNKPAKQDSEKNRGGVPDLLADNGHLHKIRGARDSLRAVLNAAREYDRKSDDTSLGCEADMHRFVMLLCGRLIGVQTRELTETDRQWLQQILGLEVLPAE